jgi:hypothetical protein
MGLFKSFLNLLSSDPSNKYTQKENKKYMEGKENDKKTSIKLKQIESELNNISKRKEKGEDIDLKKEYQAIIEKLNLLKKNAKNDDHNIENQKEVLIARAKRRIQRIDQPYGTTLEEARARSREVYGKKKIVMKMGLEAQEVVIVGEDLEVQTVDLRMRKIIIQIIIFRSAMEVSLEIKNKGTLVVAKKTIIN